MKQQQLKNLQKGMYGAPTDIKIRKISQSNSGMTVFLASFTTLTPAMRER
jgi:hypothetical protein